MEITLPAPTVVTVTASVGVIIVGSSPSLTCTVELTTAVDIAVTVNTVWTGPDMTTVTPTSSVMESLTRYITMANVDVARGGNYTCQASIDSLSQFITGSEKTSGLSTINVAPLPAPTNLMVSSPSPTSITLTWEQIEGANAVERYEIIYEYTVNECVGEGGSFPAITVTLNNGSLRRYTLSNSSSTPVEEDTTFSSITLTALNSVTRSDPTTALPSPNPIMTADAAPGLVQSLRMGSVDVTNMTIQWDRVNCLERNGRIDSYLVIYYPTSNPSERAAMFVFGTGDSNRMFRRTALPPQTSYTFEVEANNPFLRVVTGAIATINVSTTAPQSIGFLLSGRLYPNNSVVTLTETSPVLYCLTPNPGCCGSSVFGEWYLPDGATVSSSNTPFSGSQVPNAVSLRRGSGTPPSGVFRCEIPDASGTSQNIYVGIYPQGVGSPSITSLRFDRNSTTLICTSTGGPPTTVTWMVNGAPVNSSLYEQSQRLVDSEVATYENILFNDDIADFVGTFTCEVSNVRVTNPVRETLELNGVFIVRDQFSVGQSAIASCKSDTPVTRIEWLRDGEIVESNSTAGIQELDLMFSPVNDSIHNQVYVCRVTRMGGTPAEQNFTAIVKVPPDVLNVSVGKIGSAIAGMSYSLMCAVSKTVDGLINSPTATWTAGGVAITSGNISTMTTDTANISTLTFDPLRTSHGGRYSCDGTLTSLSRDTPLMPSTIETLHVQISTPGVSVTVPRGPLFAGSIAPLILTCNIFISSVTDTDVAIMDTDVTWLNGSTPLSDGDARVTISAVSGSRPSFTSTLTLDPLSSFDNTTFTCQAQARPPANVQSFITASEMGEGCASVIAYSPSPPTVRIVHSSDSVDSVIAGEPLTLTCSASSQEGIRGTPTLMWTKNDVELHGEESSVSLVLSFSPILIRDAGEYTCTARLTIPEAGVDVMRASTANIFVQVPLPTVTVGSREDNNVICSKTMTLNCAINQTYYGIDTEPTFTWLAPDGGAVSSEESANPHMDAQSRQLIFSDIATAMSGVYVCQIEVTSNNTARTSVNVNSNVPGEPQGLTCVSPSSQNELSLSWESPSMPQGDKLSYVVEVNELNHKTGTREVIESNFINLTTETRSENIQNLVPEVPYNVTVKALNLAGCGLEQQIFCFTQEGEPPTPENLTIVERNMTSIKVCWKRFTLVELKGLGNYTIVYRRAGRLRQATSTISVPWTDSCVTIRNLSPGVEYEITVSVSLATRISTPTQISAATISAPTMDGNNTLIIIIIVVVVVALLIIVILILLLSIYIVRRKCRSDILKLEKSRMLRVYEEPIMLNNKDRQSIDVDKEQEEAIASSELQEKRSPPSTGECELVQTQVHVPFIFIAPKEPATETSDVVSNGDGPK